MKKAEKIGVPGLETVYGVLYQRLLGVFFLGLIPLLYIVFFSGESLSSYGTSSRFLHPVPWWTLLFLAALILLIFLNAGSRVNLDRYPMIRIKTWSRPLVLLSALSWIAYLLAYEFFFRGLLFYSSLDHMGLWPAIALNTSFYAFAHLYKGPGEAFGALPLGVIFCLLTYITGNIWTVVCIHIVMALINEWLSLIKQPEMKVVRNK